MPLPIPRVWRRRDHSPSHFVEMACQRFQMEAAIPLKSTKNRLLLPISHLPTSHLQISHLLWKNLNSRLPSQVLRTHLLYGAKIFQLIYHLQLQTSNGVCWMQNLLHNLSTPSTTKLFIGSGIYLRFPLAKQVECFFKN